LPAQDRSRSPDQRTKLVVASRIGNPTQTTAVETPTAMPTTVNTNCRSRKTKLTSM
jgi:hypothetical protein